MSMAYNRDTCASGFMLLLFTAVRKWNQPRHPSTNECIVNYAQLSKLNSQDKAYQWEILYSVRSPGVLVWMRNLFIGSNIWTAGIQLVTLWAKVREALGDDPWLEKGSHWRRALSHSLSLFPFSSASCMQTNMWFVRFLFLPPCISYLWAGLPHHVGLHPSRTRSQKQTTSHFELPLSGCLSQQSESN